MYFKVENVEMVLGSDLIIRIFLLEVIGVLRIPAILFFICWGYSCHASITLGAYQSAHLLVLFVFSLIRA